MAVQSVCRDAPTVIIDPELLTLGREVRRLRKERGLSQEALADLSELHTNYIGGIERGERNVGIKAMMRIATALQVHPSDLFAVLPPRSST